MSRGVVLITLGGEAFQMAPSYGAIRDIEARSGLPIAELLHAVTLQVIKYEEAALIVWYGTQAANDALSSVEAIGNALFADRLTAPHIRASLAQFLLACLWAPEEAKKKFETEVAPAMGLPSTGADG